VRWCDRSIESILSFIWTFIFYWSLFND